MKHASIDERDAEIIALEQAGLCNGEIARRLNLSDAVVAGRRFRLRQRSVLPSRAKKQPIQWSEERVAALKRCVTDGLTSKQAAGAMGASLSGVRKKARALKLEWAHSKYKNGARQGDAARRKAAAKEKTRDETNIRPVAVLSAAEEHGLILDFLARRGVRRFEPGATGDTGHLLDWLKRACGRDARRLSSAQAHGLIFQVDGKRYDLAGLIDVVDEERRRRGLQPLRREAARCAGEDQERAA